MAATAEVAFVGEYDGDAKLSLTCTGATVWIHRETTIGYWQSGSGFGSEEGRIAILEPIRNGPFQRHAKEEVVLQWPWPPRAKGGYAEIRLWYSLTKSMEPTSLDVRIEVASDPLSQIH